MRKPPKNPKKTGPVRSKRRLPKPKGNPTKGGGISGNLGSYRNPCSMPKK